MTNFAHACDYLGSGGCSAEQRMLLFFRTLTIARNVQCDAGQMRGEYLAVSTLLFAKLSPHVRAGIKDFNSALISFRQGRAHDVSGG